MTFLGGLDYDRMHACINDCILFCGMHKKARHCPTCGEARYRMDVKSFDVPHKVLQHFSIMLARSYRGLSDRIFLDSYILVAHAQKATIMIRDF